MVVYFLYREVELINIHFKQEILLLKEQLLELTKCNKNAVLEEEFSKKLDLDQELELELELDLDLDTDIKVESNKKTLEKSVEEYSNEMIYTPEKNLTENTIKQASQEQASQVQAVVPQQQNERDALDNTNEKTETTVELLLKNKLNELQALAHELNINITQNGKKKTKIQLAQEIYSIKKNI